MGWRASEEEIEIENGVWENEERARRGKGGKEEGRKGGREGWRKGGREGRMKSGRERGREGGMDGEIQRRVRTCTRTHASARTELPSSSWRLKQETCSTAAPAQCTAAPLTHTPKQSPHLRRECAHRDLLRFSTALLAHGLSLLI